MKRLLLLLLPFLLISCADSSSYEPYYYSGAALGTSYNLTIHGKKEKLRHSSLDSLFRKVNQSMSTYQADSDISRINEGDTTVKVDNMFREVFTISQEVYQETGGAFDPTVGVLVDAWGFGPGKAIKMDSTIVDSLKTYVGFDKVQLLKNGSIRKASPGLRFDFNAVAKGYTIDRIAVLLESLGYQNFLLELGGEVVARGKNMLKEKPWMVGVDDPEVEQGRELIAVLSLHDEALASSGNYRKFRVDPDTGEHFVHTVDPRTGYTRNSNILASTVIASQCAVADAYATAFMAMDLDASRKLLAQSQDLEAYIIYVDEGGETAEFMTPGFKSRVSGPRE